MDFLYSIDDVWMMFVSEHPHARKWSVVSLHGAVKQVFVLADPGQDGEMAMRNEEGEAFVTAFPANAVLAMEGAPMLGKKKFAMPWQEPDQVFVVAYQRPQDQRQKLIKIYAKDGLDAIDRMKTLKDGAEVLAVISERKLKTLRERYEILNSEDHVGVLLLARDYRADHDETLLTEAKNDMGGAIITEES